jgi:hypothetical protein
MLATHVNTISKRTRQRMKSEKQTNKHVDPPSTLKSEPDETTERVLLGLISTVPIFRISKPIVTARMVASVMRITGVCSSANDDDVANVLTHLRAKTSFQNGNCYFDLNSFSIPSNSRQEKPK